MVEFRTTLNSSKTQAVNNNVFKKIWWLFVLFSLILVTVGVVGIVLPEDYTDVVFGIIMICFGVLFTPLVFLLTRLLQRNLNKSASFISDDTQEVYTFDENEITISQKKGEVYESFTRAKYEYLYKVEETPTHYFLYISKAQCHVIDKASITQGSFMELNAHLVNNLRLKFKPSKNNKLQ